MAFHNRLNQTLLRKAGCLSHEFLFSRGSGHIYKPTSPGKKDEMKQVKSFENGCDSIDRRPMGLS